MHRGESRSDEGRTPSEDVLSRIRVPLVRRASLVVAGRTEEVFAIDVGLSGVFVERAVPLAPDERVEVQFYLPDNEIPITARCRVAFWRGEPTPGESQGLPPGAGLEFVEMAPGDRERLREYLSDYYRREPKTRRFVRHGA